jgi:8-oxo-dGTP pyrophosphatase MutT (NUDIX family)
MGSPSKACAIVIRAPAAIEVLAFEHPLAGLQLVKGTIEAGETPQQAAVRELREEAGFGARAVEDLGE